MIYNIFWRGENRCRGNRLFISKLFIYSTALHSISLGMYLFREYYNTLFNPIVISKKFNPIIGVMSIIITNEKV